MVGERSGRLSAERFAGYVLGVIVMPMGTFYLVDATPNFNYWWSVRHPGAEWMEYLVWYGTGAAALAAVAVFGLCCRRFRPRFARALIVGACIAAIPAFMLLAMAPSD